MAGHPGGPPPDDARLAPIAEAIDRLRGSSFPFVLWSGPLPAGSDVHDQVEELMREPWGLFTGTSALDREWPQGSGLRKFEEISEQWAARWLTWILGHDLAYAKELVPPAQANELATRFIDLLPSTRRWFWNGDEVDDDIVELPSVTSWNPLTGYTFDKGVIAAGEGRAYIAWFTGED